MSIFAFLYAGADTGHIGDHHYADRLTETIYLWLNQHDVFNGL